MARKEQKESGKATASRLHCHARVFRFLLFFLHLGMPPLGDFA